MSRVHAYARRRALVGAVQKASAHDPGQPTAEITTPTPGAVPVPGIARTVQWPVSRKQRPADPLGGTDAGAEVVTALRRRRGSGSTLPNEVAERFGEHLRTDLSAVRVHTDAEADAISRSVGAHAFTHGNDIYFASGAYDAGASGQRVLAHELAHVAQHANGRFRGAGAGVQIGRADDPAEADADRTANQVVSALRRAASPHQPSIGDPRSNAADGDMADGGAIRRFDIGSLQKRYGKPPPQEADGGGRPDNAYATELKDADDDRGGGYSTPDLTAANDDGGGSRNAYATELKDADDDRGGGYSTPDLTAANDDGEHAAAVYSEFKPNAGGAGAGPRPEDLELKDAIEQAEHEDEQQENQEQEAKEQDGAGAGNAGAKQARVPGSSSTHKAWLVARLSAPYAGEAGRSSQGLIDVVTPHLDRIAVYWAALNEIGKLPDDADAAAKEALAAKLKPRFDKLGQMGPKFLGQAFFDEVNGLPLDELAQRLIPEYERCIAWLERQEFPIKQDGTLDLPKTSEDKYDISGRTVKYLDGDEREATTVTFTGGMLKRDAKWQPPKSGDGNAAAPGGAVAVDTADSVTHFSGPGWEIFVVGANGEIHMTSHKVSVIHHSSLLAGADVTLGGEMKVANGRIVEMTNKSGHYMPTADMFVQFLHWLDKDKINLDFKVSGFGVLPGRTAKQLLDGVDATGTVRPERTYEALKTNAVYTSLVQQYTKAAVTKVLQEEKIIANGKEFTKDGTEITLKEFRQLLKRRLGQPKRTARSAEVVNKAQVETISWN
jgi:hypothetical protein